MALNIAITSKYNPFTYEDYIKPLEGYWEDYEKQEAALADLDTSLQSLNYIVNTEPEESSLRTTYNQYKDKLEKASQALQKEGLTAANRKALSALKSQFAKEINPIATQYKALMGQVEAQQKARQSNPSIRFKEDARTKSVSDFITNPRWQSDFYVGDTITKDVSDMLAPISKMLTDYRAGNNINGYNSFLQQHGLSIQDVLDYFNNPQDTNPMHDYIGNAIGTAIANSGVGTWNDQRAYNEALQFAKQGVYKTIGQTSVDWRQPIQTSIDTGQGGAGSQGDYPAPLGDSVRFDISYNPDVDSEAARQAEADYEYATNNLGVNPASTPDVAKAKKVLTDKGLDVDKDFALYKEYLEALAEAKRKDAGFTSVYPEYSAEYKVKHDERYAKFQPSPTGVRRADGKPEVSRPTASYDEVLTYEKALQKAQEVLGNVLAPDSVNGVYGGTLQHDAQIAATLALRQSKNEIYLGAYTGNEAATQSILRGLQIDYDTLKAANNTSKGGNGLYELDMQTGEEEYVKNPDQKLWTDGALIVSPKDGLLIAYNQKMYKLKGTKADHAVQNVVNIREVLRDFSPQSIKDFLRTKKTNGASAQYTSVDLQDLLMSDTSLFNKLKDGSDLVSNSKTKTYVSYVRLNTQGTPLAKLVFSNDGHLLTYTTLESELSGSTPGSERFFQTGVNNAMFHLQPSISNSYVGPATTSKAYQSLFLPMQ